ncbi:MAG TPA: DUF4136 domain-containing protein [Novosphingobium sp.]|nr:DUF4136 domain-containing protein [Novosphingobium sp.]HQA18759.1 DUF4136 domain-containing protein [Novosphingobium sp.]
MVQESRSPLGWVKLALVPLMLAALAACATPFKADVQRFSAQLPAPQGQTYAVIADDPALTGGLEFSQYAALVDAKMGALGYVRAADPATADLIVKFDYGVDKGRDQVRSTGFADPYWSSWYGYSRWGYVGRRGYYRPYYPHGAWGYGWYDPWFSQGYESYTVYISAISLKIDRRADGQRLFEGRAEAASTSNRLGYLVPNLVEAMFTDFPGHNGETVRISVAPEKKKN